MSSDPPAVEPFTAKDIKLITTQTVATMAILGPLLKKSPPTLINRMSRVPDSAASPLENEDAPGMREEGFESSFCSCL